MKLITTILSSVLVGVLIVLLPSNNLFETFVPRSFCMRQNQNLIALHGISDGIIWLSYMSISISLFGIYSAVTERFLPYKGFVWLFGAFIMLCGFTHLFELLDLRITFYWVDGIIKSITAMVSIIVAIRFLPAARTIRNMKTETEYNEIRQRCESLEQRLKIIENTK